MELGNSSRNSLAGDMLWSLECHLGKLSPGGCFGRHCQSDIGSPQCGGWSMKETSDGSGAERCLLLKWLRPA